MATLELQAKKAELAKDILSLESEEIVNELSRIFNSLMTKYPCMHTPEEIIAGAKGAVKAYREGRGVSHEEMKKRHIS